MDVWRYYLFDNILYISYHSDTRVIIVIQEDKKTSKQLKREIVEAEKIRQWQPADKAEVESQQTDQVPIETTDPIVSEITEETLDESTEGIPTLSFDPADVKYSPHGLGPYPYVSKELVLAKGLTSWQTVELFGAVPPSKNAELMSRVLVKLWNDGDRSWVGGVFENGKVYVNYPNRVYAAYAKLRNLNGRVQRNPDGTPRRYISSWQPGGDITDPTQ